MSSLFKNTGMDGEVACCFLMKGVQAALPMQHCIERSASLFFLAHSAVELWAKSPAPFGDSRDNGPSKDLDPLFF